MIEITLEQRLLLSTILPKQGSYVENIIARDLLGKLELTQRELSDYEFTFNGVGYVWNEKGVKARFHIELSDGEERMLINSLKACDQNKSLPMGLTDVYEALCG